jgi:hypothetical protein
MRTMKGIQPINDLIYHGILRSTPGALALYEILQQILKCPAEIASVEACLPDEIIVQSDIESTLWRSSIVSHRVLSCASYAHIYMPLVLITQR